MNERKNEMNDEGQLGCHIFIFLHWLSTAGLDSFIEVFDYFKIWQ